MFYFSAVIQNNLQFVAASNLDAATFQVSYQMKILTTAGFSVFLLRKKLSSTQWLALLCLAIGVGIVQIQAGAARTVTAVGVGHASAISSLDVHSMNAMKGFMAVAAACFTSGLAGVYFEMVLKNSQGDLWVRNVQLSLFSLLPALVPVVFSQASGSAPGGAQWFAGLFRNFGVWAWATVVVQVLGGLVTAMVIKYSDNILKGFATSLSIVISFLASVALFDFQMSFTFILGSAIVLIATWLYNQQPRRLGRGKDSIEWSLCWAEKGRGPASSIRSPAVGPVYGGLAVLSSSSSRSSSSVSLTSLLSSTTVSNSPPLSNSDNPDGKDKKKIMLGR
jgi:UDP-sugar transporter A1/2/3